MEEGFAPMIEELQAMCSGDGTSEAVNAEDLEEMGLTFCIPRGGVVHDLIPNGRDVPVTIPRTLR